VQNAISAEISGFLNPRRVYSRQEVLARLSPVPAAGVAACTAGGSAARLPSSMPATATGTET